MERADVHGPIDFVLIEFHADRLTGGAAQALLDLVDKGIVTLYDVLVVGKADDGSVYSLALQRGSVTAASTALVVTQTMVPTIVGVTFLGDQVRSGFWPVAVAGFLLTAAAAAVLVRFEGVEDPVRDAEESSAPI